MVPPNVYVWLRWVNSLSPGVGVIDVGPNAPWISIFSHFKPLFNLIDNSFPLMGGDLFESYLLWRKKKMKGKAFHKKGGHTSVSIMMHELIHFSLQNSLQKSSPNSINKAHTCLPLFPRLHSNSMTSSPSLSIILLPISYSGQPTNTWLTYG